MLCAVANLERKGGYAIPVYNFRRRKIYFCGSGHNQINRPISQAMEKARVVDGSYSVDPGEVVSVCGPPVHGQKATQKCSESTEVHVQF